MGGPEIPSLEMVCSRLDGGLIIQILKRQPDLVGAGGLEVTLGETVAGLALAAREVGCVLQPHVAALLQLRAALHLLAPHLVDRRVDDLDGVELV